MGALALTWYRSPLIMCLVSSKELTGQVTKMQQNHFQVLTPALATNPSDSTGLHSSPRVATLELASQTGLAPSLTRQPDICMVVEEMGRVRTQQRAQGASWLVLDSQTRTWKY